MTTAPAGWPAGVATGVGSLPGTDPVEVAALVFGELPDLPHLAELPARGPGADLLGRTAGNLLADLAVDLQPAGWRLVARPGVDQRRARDLLARDLDSFERAAEGYAGPMKVQAAGPWTLAAGVELPRGDRALADPRAVRDLVEALAEGLTQHVAELGRRVPGARFVVQLDEPSLPAVLAGHVLTASGFDVLPTPEATTAADHLRVVLAALAGAGALPLVHCCAPSPPVELLVEAGARVLSVDAAVLTRYDDDGIGIAVEAGVGLLLGVVPGVDARLPEVSVTLAPVQALWSRLGFPTDQRQEVVSLAPSCGLAGASPAYARAALAHCREAARALWEAD